MMQRKFVFFIIFLTLSVGVYSLYKFKLNTTIPNRWDGARAMQDIGTLLSFGPRSLGTSGHKKTIDFIKDELERNSINVTLQQGFYHGPDGVMYPITNIIGRFDPTNPHRIIVGTHYDSIVRAYADSTNSNAIMPGANNSASGVALLLETARLLNSVKKPSVGIDFIFFDGEEGPKSLGAGDPQWFPLGSPYFVNNLSDFYTLVKPVQGIIFDMVCDKNLELYPEQTSIKSDSSYVQTFWEIGEKVSSSSFLSTPTLAISDDHNALIQAGIPSFLVIDFSYNPWFNTTQDTLDKCSPNSLQSVGLTLVQYLYTFHFPED